MRLDKAIEVLKEINELKPTVDLSEWRDAVNLGIEALKRIQSTSPKRALPGTWLLPGETVEGEHANPYTPNHRGQPAGGAFNEYLSGLDMQEIYGSHKEEGE